MLLLNIIKDFGSKYDLLLGSTYGKAITFMIPRSIYPDKTDNFTITTARLYEPGANTSFSSTALGEMYANFGLLSVPLLPIYTLALLFISRLVCIHLNRHALLSATLFLLFAWMSRSVFADNFVAILFCFALIWSFRFEKGLLYPAINSKLLRPTV